MDAQPDARELLVADNFRGLVTSWRCSVCDKAFHIPLERATDILAAPEDVQREFEQHTCSRVAAEGQSSS